MMTKKGINDSKGEFFLLLLILLALHVIKGGFSSSPPDRFANEEKVFVGISGDITRPGIYGFSEQPTLEDLMLKAGGFLSETEKGLPSEAILYCSGTDVEVQSNEKGLRVFRGEMSAFYKITLRIPISLNRESLEGLTAIRGVGPGIASAIVRERARRGGFKSLYELMSIPGIGRKLYAKIRPYLIL